MHLDSVLIMTPLVSQSCYTTKEDEGQSPFSPLATIGPNALNHGVPFKDYYVQCGPLSSAYPRHSEPCRKD